MITHEGHLSSADGTRLFERSWLPDAAPKAAVLIVHGYAEHCGRYAWTAEQLVARGYAVFAFDLRGHGQSAGERVLIRSMNEYLDDVDAALVRVREQSAVDLPVFVLGHSMGGGVLGLYACARIPRGAGRERIKGLIFSGAVLPGKGSTGGPMIRLLLAAGRLFPNLRLRSLAASTVSRDPAIVADYDSDPLNYRGKMPMGLIAAMIRGGRYIDRHLHEIALPLQILHGSADQLVGPGGSRRLYEEATSTDKTLKIYEGLYHEILNEPEKDLVVADIANWLDRHISVPQPTTAASS